MLKLALIFMAVGLPLAVLGARLRIDLMRRMAGGIAALGLVMFAIWLSWWIYDSYFRYG